MISNQKNTLVRERSRVQSSLAAPASSIEIVAETGASAAGASRSQPAKSANECKTPRAERCEIGARQSTGRTQLYRHFDAEGCLLYVGISLSALVRTRQHRDNSSWFPNVVKITIETYATRDEALEAETLAIERERPVFNVRKTLDEIEATRRAADVELAKMVIAAKITSLQAAYSPAEAARELGIYEFHVNKLIKAGKLRACRIGTRTVITGWAMLEFLEYVDASERVDL